MSPRALRTVDDVLALVRTEDVRVLDVRWCDLAGAWQHASFAAAQVDAELLARGLPWRHGEASGVLVPDVATARLDPFPEASTVAVLAELRDVDGADHPLDARATLRRTHAAVVRDVGTHVLAAAALDFFVLDDVRYSSDSRHEGFWHVDARSAAWNSGREEFPNLAHKSDGAGASLPPADDTHDLRSEAMLALVDLGVPARAHRPGAAGAGQGTLELAPRSAVEAADAIIWLKHVVRCTARRHGRTATFMPRPLAGEHGSALSLRVQLRRGDEREPATGDAVERFAAGVRRHLPALCAFAAPTTNSYRWSGTDPRALRASAAGLELVGDSSASPYLALAAVVAAGLDGIANGSPDVDPPPLPRDLGAALAALDSDHAFLLQGGMFESATVRAWLDARAREHALVQARPHPLEFALYFGL